MVNLDEEKEDSDACGIPVLIVEVLPWDVGSALPNAVILSLDGETATPKVETIPRDAEIRLRMRKLHP